MLVLVTLLAAADVQTVDLHALVSQAQARMRVSDCDGKSCRAQDPSRYRLAGYQPVEAPGAKARAFAASDGSYCGVVGDKYCLSDRHPVFRTGESPFHTIMSALP